MLVVIIAAVVVVAILVVRKRRKEDRDTNAAVELQPVSQNKATNDYTTLPATKSTSYGILPRLKSTNDYKQVPGSKSLLK